MKLRKIKVYGNLRKFLGSTYFEAAVSSPEQAFNFLRANFQGVDEHMKQQFYKVKMGGMDITQDLLSIKGDGEIQIIPVAVGSGFIFDAIEDAFDFIVDNIVPIVVTYFTGGLNQVFLYIGMQLASDFLAPDQPSNPTSSVGDTDPSMRGSYTFNGIQNVSSSGVPIPIVYGHVFSGSIMVSSGVDNAQLVAILANEGTYTQSGNLVTININNHPFVNGENIRLDFTSGSLNGSNIDGAVFGVQDVTTNNFKVSTGQWNSQTDTNSGNTVRVTERNLP